MSIDFSRESNAMCLIHNHTYMMLMAVGLNLEEMQGNLALPPPPPTLFGIEDFSLDNRRDLNKLEI